jgi:hypothetical protein
MRVLDMSVWPTMTLPISAWKRGGVAEDWIWDSVLMVCLTVVWKNVTSLQRFAFGRCRCNALTQGTFRYFEVVEVVFTRPARGTFSPLRALGIGAAVVASS